MTRKKKKLKQIKKGDKIVQKQRLNKNYVHPEIMKILHVLIKVL